MRKLSGFLQGDKTVTIRNMDRNGGREEKIVLPPGISWTDFIDLCTEKLSMVEGPKRLNNAITGEEVESLDEVKRGDMLHCQTVFQ